MFNLTDSQIEKLNSWLEEKELTSADVMEDDNGYYIITEDTDSDEEHTDKKTKVYIEEIINEDA